VVQAIFTCKLVSTIIIPFFSLHSTTISITFLATLFLLLFVSSGIVLRSYILRRRFQRQIDEAVAAGFLLSPRAQGSRKRHFGAKPKIYNSWVTSGGHKWSEMMVSETIILSPNTSDHFLFQSLLFVAHISTARSR
jgi:hypothetical protein